jgi:hypothetical protein
MDEHDFIAARRLAALIAVPATVRHTSPETAVAFAFERV